MARQLIRQEKVAAFHRRRCRLDDAKETIAAHYPGSSGIVLLPLIEGEFEKFAVVDGQLSNLQSWVTMPTGPKGWKRPADEIGNAVRVKRIATDEGRGTAKAG